MNNETILTSAQATGNLLINGDFRVNQRGKSSYTDSSSYTVDRWKMNGGNSTLTVNEDGTVTHALGSTNYVSIIQFIEFPSRLAGKTVTFSAKYSTTDTVAISIRQGTTSSYTSLVTQAFSDTEVATRSVSVTLPDDLTDDDGLYVVLMTRIANTSTTWHYAKLEIGDHATAYFPRPYAQELAMCQRYYYKIVNTVPVLLGFMFSATAVRLGISLPVPLRTSPTLVLSGSASDMELYSAGSLTTLSAFAIHFYDEGGEISLSGTTQSSLSQYYTVACRPQQAIAFDAEMY